MCAVLASYTGVTVRLKVSNFCRWLLKRQGIVVVAVLHGTLPQKKIQFGCTVRSESRCALMKVVGSDVHEPQGVKTELNKRFTGIALQPLFNN
jgi:hypothetical protein